VTFELLPYPSPFQKQLDHILDKYPKSRDSTLKFIESLKKFPTTQGDRIPRYGNVHLRKARCGFEEHGISKRDGARVVFIVNEEKKKISLIAIYLHSEYSKEASINEMLKRNFKAILDEIS
jgi:hypothetical protein